MSVMPLRALAGAAAAVTLVGVAAVAPAHASVSASTTGRGLPTLSRGMTGPYVANLQRTLSIRQTGVYDASTVAAVKRIQVWKKVAPANGIVNVVTWAAIADPTLTRRMVTSAAARRTMKLSVWQTSVHGYGIAYRESNLTCRAVSPAGLYRGKWQMSSSLWSHFGGRAFAPTADQASCQQQDTVAFRVWQAAGWGPWNG